MKSREKIILGILSLVIAFSMIANTSAVVVGDSEVGVDAGDSLSWKVTVNGTSVAGATIGLDIDSVNSTGGNLQVIGDYLVAGVLISPNIVLLDYNKTDGYYDAAAQDILALLGGIGIIPKLNLTLAAEYLNSTIMFVDAIVVGTDTITCNSTGDLAEYTMKYNSNGILTKGEYTSVLGTGSITLVGGGGVSFGYAVFLIVPVAVIAVIIKKRKSTKLV